MILFVYMNKSIRIIFYLLSSNFVLLLGVFFVPQMQELFQGEAFLLPCFTFSVLGLALLVSSLKSEIKLKEKRALLATSIGALGFFVSIFLHNAFYALAEISSSIPVLPTIFEFLQIIFFLAAIFLSPILFLFGTITFIVITRSK